MRTPQLPTGLRLYPATAFFARLAEEGAGVAVVLLALARTGSATQGAYTLTAWMAPHVLAAPLVGAVAARMQRPRFFYAGALGGFAAAIAALALLMGRAPVPVTLATALVGGCCGPVVSGGLSGLIASLVPAGASRDRAYARDAAVYNAASVAGPAVVSVIAGLTAPGPGMWLLAGAAATAAVLATALPHPRALPGACPAEAPPAPVPPAAPTTLRSDLAASLAAVRHIPELRAITSATCLAFVGIGGLTTAAVLLATYRGSPGSGGALMTAFAVGALAGSLALARREPRIPVQQQATVALLGTGLALGAAALIPAPPVIVALFAIAGLFDGPLLTATLRIRADHAPARVRAQVFTLGAGLKITAAACGAALAGLAAPLPPPALLLAIAALQLAGALLHARGRSATHHSPGAADRLPESHSRAA
ncbi:MFS transporter [Streptomyces sp. GS7]|uniref:MFS transporter n=1 Tax=Streptomyces sp. GS7 TaxID=2692234 RepID=UPI001317E1FD|nr:MFS transporter [Streptomyces sp. GS7]QHC25082.1 MFS transporter [Streptomyces sp. GS7]